MKGRHLAYLFVILFSAHMAIRTQYNWIWDYQTYETMISMPARLSEKYVHQHPFFNSRQGNYIAVTVVVRATSRDQLDAIYQDLVGHDDVIMAI